MADNIASFLFDHAVLLMPAVIVACVALLVLLIRKWPARIWTRIGAAALSLVFVALAAIASGLLYMERNIRAILQHRVNALTLHPIAGTQPSRVADLRGRVVLVNFWATWCPPCRAEMPDINRIADEYRTKNVCVLTITDEPRETIDLYQQKVIALRGTTATFESDQPRGALATMAYQGRPTTMILDTDGRVRDIFIGKQSYETLRRAIERRLRG